MKTELYPNLVAELIKNPSRFYAFPILGMLVKIIILIPVMIELFFVAIGAYIFQLINSLNVLFTGKYMDVAYQLNLGLMRLSTKVYFFVSGITNKYPGFELTINDKFSVDIAKPTNPSRFFAIPIFGGLVRLILLIPFFIYQGVIQYASGIGVFGIGWIPVLFMGTYVEGIFQIARDYQRLGLASSAYMSGFSDNYPSFSIDLKNHRTLKIILIILGILAFVGNMFNSNVSRPNTQNQSINYQQFEIPAE